MRDLQRLAPDVLAGVLPRLYPRMLAIAYEHQDAGRPIFICTAASQEMAELMAIVLTFDGAVGSVSEVVDGHYTGRAGGPFTYREGKAQAIRELAEREGIDLAASWAYSDSESDLPMLRARRPSRRGQPGHGARARGARGGLGDPALRPARAAAARRRGGAGRRGGRRHRLAGAAAVARMSLHELTAEQQEIRDARAPLRRRADRARARPSGTASTPSRASSSPSSASSG